MSNLTSSLAHVLVCLENSLNSVSQFCQFQSDIEEALQDLEIACIVDVVFTVEPSMVE
jgi:hypothetical protein